MMERGDHVIVTQGTYVGCTGQIIFLDHVSNLATVGLDQYSMMLKVSIESLDKATCKAKPNEV